MGLEVVCAWCGKREERAPSSSEAPILSLSPSRTDRLPQVTHVICESCYVVEVAQVDRIVRGLRRRTPA